MRTKHLLGFAFTIDRPKGTVKEWPQPGGGVKRFVYPCDYGYLPGHRGEDGEALDFFVGDDPAGHLESFQKLVKGADSRHRLDETKFLVGLTDAERETVYRLYGPEVWHRKVYRDVDELRRDLPRFTARAGVATKAATVTGPYDVLAKEAFVGDAFRRAAGAVRGLFGGGHQPTMMPLANARPHADIVHRSPPPAERPAIVPPPPTPQAPSQPPSAARTLSPSAAPRPPLPTTQVPSWEVSKRPTLHGIGSSMGPAVPSGDFMQSTAWKPYTEGLSTEGLRPTGRTPVKQTTMHDMLLEAPGAREAFADPRVRAAFNARATADGRLVTARPGTTNAMTEHLMRQNPARVTPELLLSAFRSPEYAAIRARYKGAAARGKYAALARYGFKRADAKFADIDKRIGGEVLVAGNTDAIADAFRGLDTRGAAVEGP